MRYLLYVLCRVLALLAVLPFGSSRRNYGQVDSGVSTLCDYALAEAIVDRSKLIGDLHRFGNITTILPTTLPELESMMASLSRGCMDLNVGQAGRSGAVMMETADSQWVLKRIKEKEYQLLDQLLGVSDRNRWITIAIRDWASSTIRGTKMADKIHLLPENWLSAQAGTRFWVDTECKSFQLGCIRDEDPYGTYHRHFAYKCSLIVPFKLVVSSERIIVMPSFTLEPHAIIKDLGQDLRRSPVKKFDVKPLQVPKSRERRPFLRTLVKLQWAPVNDESLICGTRVRDPKSTDALWSRSAEVRGRECWRQLQTMLSQDTALLEGNWGKKLIDYSLMFTLAELAQNVSEIPADFQLPASCILSRRPGSSPLLLCVNIIDYLMDYSPTRWMESLLKGRKFKRYASGIGQLLACVGDLSSADCEHYLEDACGETVTDDWCNELARRKFLRIQEAVGSMLGHNGLYPDSDSSTIMGMHGQW
mmetsp:Transcript_22382/g.40320  ORF Transcript_22382/g.40320 Transcript_22382/m.40320 type:complete len:476 (-) Transcript_22382:453-1880(-)|eukprot:CAMPEP_0197632758 /NCGR_PEP_ID=MMETSP1338-20131121/9352_1 /TAXON_ID=43686 ORGANISM="Pelagodinium beii, Strain RCC1491" /NCGR_SAMPLE_ID=MMETSP1338 /ASSEMBLY_ACC=CAM_ASM_000754 /LENGTH=475 /DNA_ID=CAMNT_0043204329 /DNA_START=204 /DNA_END=1628 /DNA_ORIENTATION=+